MSTQPADLLDGEPSTVATAAADGSASMTFNQPEPGWVWSGTIILASYPDQTVPVPSTAIMSVFVGSSFWGNYTAGTGAQIQARGARTVTVKVKGLTPTNQYQAVWNGGKAPLEVAPFLAPFPGSTH